LLSAWSTHAKNHATTTTRTAPCAFTVQATRIDHCDTVTAGIHGVFNQVLTRQTDTDLAVATHLAIAKDATILTINLKSLDLLQLFFATDCFASLLHNFLRARVGECCGCGEQNERYEC